MTVKLTSTGPAGAEDELQSEYHSSFLASVERNQMRISRGLLLLLLAFHLYPNPVIHSYTSKFVILQNRYPHGQFYDIHIDDTYYVIFWVILLTFLRTFLMEWVFNPFAKHVCKIESRFGRTRFAEQSWSFVYYSISFIFGMALYIHSPYYETLDNVFVDWPHTQMSAFMKHYYLIQLAFWFQQIFVLNIEKRRKDHFNMFSHHIITCMLVVGSYYYYFTRMGHLILIIMDSVDIFLALAKMLKYAGRTTLCDVMFVIFLVSWIILRHGFYNVLFYHTWIHSAKLMGDSKCGPGVVTKRCWNNTIIDTFLGLLFGLQAITLIWMYLIFKVAYKVVTGKGAEDVRSDDESEYEEEEREREREQREQREKEGQEDEGKGSGKESESDDFVIVDR